MIGNLTLLRDALSVPEEDDLRSRQLGEVSANLCVLCASALSFFLCPFFFSETGHQPLLHTTGLPYLCVLVYAQLPGGA